MRLLLLMFGLLLPALARGAPLEELVTAGEL